MAAYGPKPPGSAEAETQARYDEERALHERVKREQRELALEIERGNYLPRDAQRQAAATALAVLTQALRSIPDNLERSLGLDPSAVEAVGIQIDAALADAAQAFQAMTNDA